MENKPASAGLNFFRMWHVCLVRSFGFSLVALDLYSSVKRLVSLLVIHIHENAKSVTFQIRSHLNESVVVVG